jgi:ATP-dependent helicase/nuclease subunit A
MSELTWTHEQHSAIFLHDRNLAVSAGAGSGKTHILTRRFVELLHARPDWRLNQIVAITFSNRAAGEMRDRVRGLILERAGEDVFWQQRLNEMDSARISTIHSLCARLLRANAAEAGVDPDFAVLEEADATILREQAIEDTLAALTAERDPAAPGLPAEPARLRHALELASQHPFAPPDDPALERWQRRYDEISHLTARAVCAHPAANAMQTLRPPADDRIGDMALAAQRALAMLAAPHNSAQVAEALQALNALKLQGGRPAAWGGKEMLDDAKAQIKALREMTDAAWKALGPPLGAHDEHAAALLAGWQHVLEIFRSAYSQRKRAQAALDFDDLELLTRVLLQDDAVAARYCAPEAGEFQHVMVDEFQDTSRAQWDIIQRLAPPVLPGRLFIVGDPRQSIYAFRGADPTVFEEAEAAICAAGGQSLSLDTSFRTHQPLVACFNHLFAGVLQRDETSLSARYQCRFGAPMRAQRHSAPSPEPTLELFLFDRDSAAVSPPPNAETVRLWEARVLADHITGLLGGGRTIFDRQARIERPATCGDIALLLRRMSNAAVLEGALRDRGLPFITLGGRAYYDRPEVWDCIHLLTVLERPTDDLALASLLRSPMFSFSDDGLFALRLPRAGTPAPERLWDALYQRDAWLPDADQPRAAFAREALAQLRARAGRVSIAELLESALDHTGYLAALSAMRDGARRRANVEKLLDQALRFGRSGRSVGAFVRALGKLSALDVRESEAALSVEGALRILTIHASKGLEFPIVIVADAGAQGKGSDPPSLLFDPELGWVCRPDGQASDDVPLPFAYRHAKVMRGLREQAESRRIFYVAATRAQDLLVLSGASATGDDNWLGWAERAFANGTAEPRQPVQDLPAPPPTGHIRLHQPVFTPQPRARAGRPQPPLEPQGAAPTAPPPGLAPLPPARAAGPHVLRAAALADLGGALHAPATQQQYFRRRWRLSVLRDAPPALPPIAGSPRRVPRRLIGDLVHYALRWDDLETGAVSEALLDAHAWALGLTQTAQRRSALAEAGRVLAAVRRSQLYAAVREAARAGRPVHRELPFVYPLPPRTIHGVIDVLFQQADGRWAIADYKTDRLGADETAEAHATQYLPQVALYAAAARDLLVTDQIDVYIHYIQRDHTVRVAPERWQAALQRIEHDIRELSRDEHESG